MDVTTLAQSSFNPTVLEQIPGALKNVVDNGDLSGAVTLIWRKGEIVQVNVIGQADLEAARPMRRDTLFRIASMTNPVTSVAAPMLMEEGRFQLSRPLPRWAPQLSAT